MTIPTPEVCQNCQAADTKRHYKSPSCPWLDCPKCGARLDTVSGRLHPRG